MRRSTTRSTRTAAAAFPPGSMSACIGDGDAANGGSSGRPRRRLRPSEADGRDVVGHFEGDLIVGSFNRSAIVTIFDRASRFNLLADLPEGHTAQATLAALVELFERVPEHLRKTLTWDQGREMAAHATLAELVGIDVYLANPYAPWEPADQRERQRTPTPLRRQGHRPQRVRRRRPQSDRDEAQHDAPAKPRLGHRRRPLRRRCRDDRLNSPHFQTVLASIWNPIRCCFD